MMPQQNTGILDRHNPRVESYLGVFLACAQEGTPLVKTDRAQSHLENVSCSMTNRWHHFAGNLAVGFHFHLHWTRPGSKRQRGEAHPTLPGQPWRSAFPLRLSLTPAHSSIVLPEVQIQHPRSPLHYRPEYQSHPEHYPLGGREPTAPVEKRREKAWSGGGWRSLFFFLSYSPRQ